MKRMRIKKTTIFCGALLFLIGCKSPQTVSRTENTTSTEPLPEAFTIAFGSCNRTDLPNLLWDDILATQPDLWIWGGDNIYADTDNMQQLRTMYQAQDQIVGYRELKSKTAFLGTWDDHDYGLNDGGVEFTAKKESQQEFLNFMDVPENSPRRLREGVYVAHDLPKTKGMVKVIVLDTRYFRTAVTPDTETGKRLKPNSYGEGTILGAAQWQWLEEELRNSKAQFNIVVSSIQLLSNEHGFEGWGNFPHEVDRFKQLVVDSRAKGVVVLSGDRHISEFSKTEIDGLSYPLIDFTSSGLTHAYRDFTGEPNPFRVGEVISTESFGTLQFDFQEKKVLFKMIGDGGKVLGTLEQRY